MDSGSGDHLDELVERVACAAVLASATAVHAQTSADVPRGGIAYSSAAEALKSLRAKTGVTFSRNEDWSIATDTDGAMWSFTPGNHYAYPSVGRRQLFKQESHYVQTEILCQAQKPACDRLHGDYQLLDRRMNVSFRAGK